MIDPETRARLFDAQYCSFKDDFPFWEHLADQTGGPILEMGCGTGRLVRALARKGYRIFGLDNDRAMLSLAQKILVKELIPRVEWVLSDLSSFRLYEPVRLAIGALNTFAYLDDAQFCTALHCAKASLQVGGLIALDLPPFDPDPGGTLEQDLPLDSFSDPIKGTAIELRAQIDAQDVHRVNVTWLYDELHPDGRITRHQWEQTYYQRGEEKVRKLIEKCGLSLHSTYGGYAFEPYKPDSERLLAVLEIKKEPE